MTKPHPDLDVTKNKDEELHPLAERFCDAKRDKEVADTEYNDARDQLALAMQEKGVTEYFCEGVEIEGHEVFVIKGKKVKKKDDSD